MFSRPTKMLVLGSLVGFGLGLDLRGLVSMAALHDGAIIISENIEMVFTVLLPLLVAHAAFLLGGSILTLLWSTVIHLSGGTSVMELIPSVLVAIVVCLPVNTFIDEGWELLVLAMLTLQSYACIWAFRQIMTLGGHIFKRRSQRPSGRIRGLLKRAAALTSTACELRRALDAKARIMAKSLPHDLTATTTDLEAGERELEEAAKKMSEMERKAEATRQLCDMRGRKMDQQTALLVKQGNNSIALSIELKAARHFVGEAKEVVARQDRVVDEMKVDAVKAQAKIAELEAQIALMSDSTSLVNGENNAPSIQHGKLRLSPSRKDMTFFGDDYVSVMDGENVSPALGNGVTPNNCGSAATMACTVSPSGSSLDSQISPSSSPPSTAGSSFVSSSSLKQKSAKKTKGQRRQARKMASKRDRMPAGALAVKSTEG